MKELFLQEEVIMELRFIKKRMMIEMENIKKQKEKEYAEILKKSIKDKKIKDNFKEFFAFYFNKINNNFEECIIIQIFNYYIKLFIGGENLKKNNLYYIIIENSITKQKRIKHFKDIYQMYRYIFKTFYHIHNLIIQNIIFMYLINSNYREITDILFYIKENK